MYFIAKVFLSAFVIALVTKLSEGQTIMAAFLKSLPLTSLLVFLFMKYEGRTNQEIAKMSWDIFYLIIPSFILFAVLPVMINKGFNFYTSLITGVALMSLGYAVMVKILT